MKKDSPTLLTSLEIPTVFFYLTSYSNLLGMAEYSGRLEKSTHHRSFSKVKKRKIIQNVRGLKRLTSQHSPLNDVSLALCCLLALKSTRLTVDWNLIRINGAVFLPHYYLLRLIYITMIQHFSGS